MTTLSYDPAFGTNRVQTEVVMPIENPAIVTAIATIVNGLLSAVIAAVIALTTVRKAQNSQDTREQQSYARKLRDLKRERLHETYQSLLTVSLQATEIIAIDPISRARSVSHQELLTITERLRATSKEIEERQALLLMYTEFDSPTAKAYGAIATLLGKYNQYMVANVRQLTQGEVTPKVMAEITELQEQASNAKASLVRAIKEDLKKYDDPSAEVHSPPDRPPARAIIAVK
jgi:hypothetical protein